ncbi:RHS repeat-associated core domain-containing protein [Saccharophagus degradans]|uniref:RHS repeat-associated core domain-containing protein n=1 Tax=Saccharophagus degradans TaxID=86304 RepID=A0AAW7X3Z6_9GAMM|nr:RHS repeat-associated core domain-containing protein [Saccharophagus degradans]MDO6421688.1 RHS repeat-associated core domain-containing protein [Saccharophagus degradans]MDO6606618.1 RHS repeat-associated core domain-containing protein [Saccharophagus degradans]
MVLLCGTGWNQAKLCFLLLVVGGGVISSASWGCETKAVYISKWNNGVEEGYYEVTEDCTNFKPPEEVLVKGPSREDYLKKMAEIREALLQSARDMSLLAELAAAQNFRDLFDGFVSAAKHAHEKDIELTDNDDMETPCPVLIRDREKVFHENDYVGSGGVFPLSLGREYASLSQSQIGTWQPSGIFGNSWFSILDTQLRLDYGTTEACWFVMGEGGVSTCNVTRTPSSITLIKNIKMNSFLRVKSGPSSPDYFPNGDPSENERIYKDGNSWVYSDASGTDYVFSDVGRLEKIRPYTSGAEWDLIYQNNSLVELVHSSGRKLVFNWKAASFSGVPPVLDSITLPTGKKITYKIEPVGTTASKTNRFLKEVIFPDGTGSIKYDWAVQGKIVAKYIDGVKWGDYTYENGRVKTSGLVGGVNQMTFSTGASKSIVTNAKGGVKEYTYDAHRRLVGVNKDASIACPGAAKDIEYYGVDDPVSKVKFKEDWDGKRTAYTYWQNGGNVRYEYVNGVTTEYLWDTNDRLIRLSYWDGAKDPSLCAANDPCPSPTQTAPMGIDRYTYGGRDDPLYYGRLKQKTTKALKFGSGTYTPERKYTYGYTFHSNGVTKRKTVDGPALGTEDSTQYNYNTFGDLLSIVSSEGHVTSYSYRTADAGRPYQVTDANGVTSNISYDARGRVKQTSAVGFSHLVTKIEYYGDNKVKKITSPTGHYIKYNLDAARRTKAVDSPFPGNEYALQQVAYEYDLINNVTAVKANLITAGNVVKNNAVVLNADFDEYGNKVADYGQNGQVTQYTYTPGGKVESVTNALGHALSRSYNAYGQLEWSKNQNNETTRYYYDRLGYLAEVEDARGNSTLYQRNGFGEVERLVSPDSGVTDYQYTVGGLLEEVKTAADTTINYTNDSIGRLRSVNAVGSDVQNIDYYYDTYYDGATRQNCQFGQGRLCAVEDNSGYTAYSYTPDGNVERQTSELDGATYQISYTYDNYRRLDVEALPGGINVRYGYDSAGNKNKVSVQVNGAWTTLVDVVPSLRKETWVYGQGSTPGGGTITAIKTFDADGRLSGYNTSFYNKAFSYDTRDYISKVTGGAEGTYYYDYDNTGRLTKEKYNNTTYSSDSYTYAYDDNGNRDSYRISSRPPTAFVLASDSNQLLQIGSEPLIYDDVGNLKEHRWNTSSASPKYKYYYDSLERMTGFYKYDTGKSTYKYNFANQRVAKYARERQNGPIVTNHYRYLYDSNGLLRAETKPNSTAVDTTYVYLNSTLVGFVRDGKLYSVLHDQTGRPQLVYTSSGSGYNVVFASKNIGFKRVIQVNTLGRMNVGFPGQYYDAESGLWYNWNRYYDENTGRYLQSDPIGLKGGLNSYSYVESNPIKYTDPLGLDITVCRWGGGLPHIGYGVNSGQTMGRRVREDASGLKPLVPLGGTVPGEVSDDHMEDVEECKTISTTSDQDKQASRILNLSSRTAQKYNLYQNSCVDFVRDSLESVLGTSYSNTNMPRTLYDEI